MKSLGFEESGEVFGHAMEEAGGLDPFFEEFAAARQDACLWHAVWHPFLTGRRARWHVVERWLETALLTGAWFATLSQIADHAEGLRHAGQLRALPFPPYKACQT